MRWTTPECASRPGRMPPMKCLARSDNRGSAFRYQTTSMRIHDRIRRHVSSRGKWPHISRRRPSISSGPIAVPESFHKPYRDCSGRSPLPLSNSPVVLAAVAAWNLKPQGQALFRCHPGQQQTNGVRHGQAHCLQCCRRFCLCVSVNLGLYDGIRIHRINPLRFCRRSRRCVGATIDSTMLGTTGRRRGVRREAVTPPEHLAIAYLIAPAVRPET